MKVYLNFWTLVIHTDVLWKTLILSLVFMLHLPGKQILRLTADEAFTEAAKVTPGVKSQTFVWIPNHKWHFWLPSLHAGTAQTMTTLLALGGSPWKWPVTYTRSHLHEQAAATPEQDADREVSAVNGWPGQEKTIPPPISENEASEQAAAAF